MFQNLPIGHTQLRTVLYKHILIKLRIFWEYWKLIFETNKRISSLDKLHHSYEKTCKLRITVIRWESDNKTYFSKYFTWEVSHLVLNVKKFITLPESLWRTYLINLCQQWLNHTQSKWKERPQILCLHNAFKHNQVHYDE